MTNTTACSNAVSLELECSRVFWFTVRYADGTESEFGIVADSEHNALAFARDTLGITAEVGTVLAVKADRRDVFYAR